MILNTQARAVPHTLLPGTENLLRWKDSTIISSFTNEDMIVVMVIALKAIANQPKKIWAFNGMRTHGLCVSAAVLY